MSLDFFKKELEYYLCKIQMIPFSDPSASYQAHKSEIDEAIKECLIRGGMY